MPLPEALLPLLGRVRSFQAREHDRDPRYVAEAFAAVYRPSDRDDILVQLAEIATPVDDDTRAWLAREGAWHVKSLDRLVARLLPLTADDEPDETVWSFPIWDHGTFDQAQVSMTSNAKHLVRFLDDYCEQTIAARRRAADRVTRRENPDADAEALRVGRVRILNKEMPSWRDTVRAAIGMEAFDELRQAVRQFTLATLTGKEKPAELELILDAAGHGDIVQAIRGRRRTREETLDQAGAVLVYEDFEFLTLTGIQDGRSVRQHLPVGLHLVFDASVHRRADRTAGLWLDACPSENQCGPYHWLPSVPPAYHDAKRTPYFRLTDDNLVAYVHGEGG